MVESKIKTQNAQTEENIKLAIMEAIVEGKGVLNEEILKKTLNNMGISNENISKNEKNGWIVKTNEKEYKISSNGEIKELKELPFKNGVTKPYLPTDDFEMEEGTNLDTGLVVKDSDGNEYVWIEVPMTIYNDSKYNAKGIPTSEEEFEKIKNCLKAYTSDYSDPAYRDGNTDGSYSEEYKEMIKSVYISGGFWVGRYEAGIEEGKGYRKSYVEIKEDDKAVIKQNMYPYNYVKKNDAQKLATRMGYKNCTSSLMYGIQWDLMLKYLENKKASDLNILKNVSTSIGNYNNNCWNITNSNAKYSEDYGNTFFACPHKKKAQKDILLTTGADKSFSLMNIYDIAGNVWEWTLEYGDISSPFVSRGGSYNRHGAEKTAVSRSYNSNGFSHTVGFRIGLWKVV